MVIFIMEGWGGLELKRSGKCITSACSTCYFLQADTHTNTYIIVISLEAMCASFKTTHLPQSHIKWLKSAQWVTVAKPVMAFPKKLFDILIAACTQAPLVFFFCSGEAIRLAQDHIMCLFLLTWWQLIKKKARANLCLFKQTHLSLC